jgi:glycerol-3-phosphate acyltransferase PlsY
VNPVLLLTLSYLAGAVPTSLWVGKGVYGVDLRLTGSGNLGATNTLRTLGWRAALPVMVLDVVKGWLPVWLFPRLLATPELAPDLGWTLAFGAAAVLGHVFSVWARFRGGKGVATSAGVFLALAPWATLVAFVVFFGVALATRIVSLGSLAAAATLPFAVMLTPHVGGNALVAFTVALAAFVIWAHRSNLRRLLRGEENRFAGSRGRAAAGAGAQGAAEGGVKAPDGPRAGWSGPEGVENGPETSEPRAGPAGSGV